QIVKAILVCAVALTVSAAQTPQVSREDQWKQDLNYFADEFPAKHIDFAKLYPQPAFNNELSALRSDITKLTDNEIVLRLMRLVASANVGHTYVYLPTLKLGFRPMPITFEWYSDGLAIVAATPDNKAALGARVLRIGNLTPEQLLAAVAPYIAHENDTWLREQSPAFFQTVKVLKLTRAMGDDNRLELTLVKPGGEPFKLVVTPQAGEQQVSIFKALDIPVPLYRKHLDRYYWYEYLSDAHILYIQYNQCANDPKLPFKDFADELLAFADAHQVDRVIVDLRWNGGGNSSIVWPLSIGLKKRPALSSRVFVLSGPKTFSSAQDNAIGFQSYLHATLIGSSTGEKPNGYGEVRLITLPNSKLTIQYCTKYFKMVKDSDPSALDPDVRVPFYLADELAGRDPVLDAAINYRSN